MYTHFTEYWFTTEINNLEKEELNDVLEEINSHESDRMKIKTEIKNFQMNATNKRLTKHKMRLETQSRRINKITIDDKAITDPDKIKKEIQWYYKYQFRCACKNKKRPKQCVICKADPSKYAKVTAKNYKRKNFRQKRITTKQKEKLDQDLSIHEVDEYVRPLTLLNMLYKIASGILAERLKTVLPTIISEDQYGFMAGKQAADLVELTREVIEDARKNKKTCRYLP